MTFAQLLQRALRQRFNEIDAVRRRSSDETVEQELQEIAQQREALRSLGTRAQVADELARGLLDVPPAVWAFLVAMIVFGIAGRLL